MEELKRACDRCGRIVTCIANDYNALEFFCDDCFEELLLEMLGSDPANRSKED